MTRKVIYLSFIRLSDHVSRDYYIDYLIEQGVVVEYWDVTNVVREKFEEHHSVSTDYLRSIQTMPELEAQVSLAENRDAVYVIMITYEARFLAVLRLLTNYRCKMVRLAWGAMPVSSKGTGGRFLGLLRSPSVLVTKLINRIKLVVAKKLRLVKPPDIVFAAGGVLVSAQTFASKVVPINLVDYDKYILAGSVVRPVVDGMYAVFLDTNLPYHSDLKFNGLSALSPREYYSSLNRFFSLLEAEHKLKIIIAAHPKSNYGSEVFEERLIFRGLTPELVKDADFVITQTSTALSYVVLNAKPVVFVYTNQMLGLYEDTLMKYLRDFSSYLHSPLVNIDAIESVTDLPLRELDLRRYESYKYDFLTSGESEHLATNEIFFNELSAM